MIIRKVDRIEHGLLNMNMISKEKYDSLVASGYYKLTSSSGLLKIPSEILDTFFDKGFFDISVENFRALLPEGKDIYDYGDICHKAVSNGYNLVCVKGFIDDLINEGYNINLRNGENEYTILQQFFLHSFCYNSSFSKHDKDIDFFKYLQSITDINAKDKNGNSIIHTAIISYEYTGEIVQLLEILSEKFDFNCKNNQNMGIIETLDDCINKYSKLNYSKGTLLSYEREAIKRMISGLIKYQKDRKQIISEKDKNNKTEIELSNINHRISEILQDRFNGKVSETYNILKKIVDDMKYYRNEITNNIVFDLDTILIVKKVTDIEYRFINYGSDPENYKTEAIPPAGWGSLFNNALSKFHFCIDEEEKIAEEVAANREHCKLIERFLKKIVYQLSFIDIIENKDLILLFKKVLKENFDYIIEHTSNMETEEDFILAWSKYEEKLKETIRVGIKILKTPVNDNETQNILKTLEAFGFNEEINLLNKKIGNTTDEANKAGNSSILAPIKKESKDQIKKILKAGLEVLLSTPDINTINMMLTALEKCGLNEEVEILKKEIADYTAGNLLEEVIEDEIKTGKLSNSEIYYLQSMFENNGFKNVSKLIENKVKEKEEKEKVNKKGKI